MPGAGRYGRARVFLRRFITVKSAGNDVLLDDDARGASQPPIRLRGVPEEHVGFAARAVSSRLPGRSHITLPVLRRSRLTWPQKTDAVSSRSGLQGPSLPAAAGRGAA